MAMLCKNCSGPLLFDADIGKTVCSRCGGQYEVMHSDDTGLVDLDSMFQDQSDPETCDVQVYSCSTCGGRIAVNDVEMTSTCPFCGNAGVIFDRVAKKRRPDAIIPFSFGKTEAEKKVRAHLSGAKFLAKDVSNLEILSVQGIYVPYYIISADYKGVLILEHDEKDSEGNVVNVEQIARSLRCRFNKLMLEASSALLDEASRAIEPYDLTGLRKFEEGYLLGFHSDMADKDAEHLCDLASKTCRNYVTETTKKLKVIPRGFFLAEKDDYLKFEGKAVYTLIPVWFVIGSCGGEKFTMLVNGQNGKVVGSPAYSKARFRAGVILTSILTVALMSAIGAFGIHLGVGCVKSGLIASAFLIFAGMGLLLSLIVRSAYRRLEKTKGFLSLFRSKTLVSFAERGKD